MNAIFFPSYILKLLDNANHLLYDCLDMVQFANIKNGVDFATVEGFLTFICYGSEYEYNNQIHRDLQFIFYDISSLFHI